MLANAAEGLKNLTPPRLFIFRHIQKKLKILKIEEKTYSNLFIICPQTVVFKQFSTY